MEATQKTTTFVQWRFTARWADHTFTGKQWFEIEPGDRDTAFIQFDIQDMLGYMPEDLEIKWEPVTE